MISDKERREVAAKLRENAGLPSRLPNEYSIEVKSALVLSKLLDCIDCSDDVFLHLADFIDRPMTHIDVNEHGRACCANCGCDDWCLADSSRYCPNCGAEVVE